MILQRAALTIPLLFVGTVLSFVLVSLTPGDAAKEILGTSATPEAYGRLRQALGLDLTLPEQYWRWLTSALSGDLGSSLFTGEPVTHAIHARLPVTLSLIIGSLLLTAFVGVALGMVSALRGGVIGRMIDAFALLGFAVPPFWAGAVLIAVFAVQLRWFPAAYVPATDSLGQWVSALVLPVVALGLHGVAATAKHTRESVLDALSSEYVRMAKANGLSTVSILFRHVAKNASITVVTALGLQFVSLLGATVLVESVFAVPGLGGLAVNASIQHDLPMIQGIVVYFTVIVVVVNLIIDLAYTWLNPKVRQ